MTAQAEPAPTLEVLAIAGSLRRGSWNRRLLTAAVDLAPPRLHLTVYDDLASIPMFDEGRELTGRGVVDALCARIAACDGLLLSTPEYCYFASNAPESAVVPLGTGRGLPSKSTTTMLWPGSAAPRATLVGDRW
jgi:chromate reductase